MLCVLMLNISIYDLWNFIFEVWWCGNLCLHIKCKGTFWENVLKTFIYILSFKNEKICELYPSLKNSFQIQPHFIIFKILITMCVFRVSPVFCVFYEFCCWILSSDWQNLFWLTDFYPFLLFHAILSKISRMLMNGKVIRACSRETRCCLFVEVAFFLPLFHRVCLAARLPM